MWQYIVLTIAILSAVGYVIYRFGQQGIPVTDAQDAVSTNN